MSNRTAHANAAIKTAWEREQNLVRDGKGTRDWTPEQQQDILSSGKAYDENGRAFEGQHMKNVEKYPEYQGNPDNIQFLTKKNIWLHMMVAGRIPQTGIIIPSLWRKLTSVMVPVFRARSLI